MIADKRLEHYERTGRVGPPPPPYRSPVFAVEMKGQDIWAELHNTADTYPVHPTELDKNRVRAWFETKINGLNCKVCEQHTRNWLEHGHQLRLNSRLDLIRFMLELHNFVNISLGRSPWTEEQYFAVRPKLSVVHDHVPSF